MADDNLQTKDDADTAAALQFRPVPRRTVLQSALAIGVSSVALGACNDDGSSGTTVEFLHGVASGDPLSNSVILWTRVTPSDATAVTVNWEISPNSDLSDPVNGGFIETSDEVDYTVKVDATGLEPDATYYYRFTVGDTQSTIGRTKTLPAAGAAVSEARLVLLSCSNHPKGFFNVYAALANLQGTSDEPDVLLHVGDYIYEYSRDGYATTANSDPRTGDVRSAELVPDAELITVEQYRQRHGLYKSDPDSQAAHRLYPLVAVWDDHEVANDSYRDGAENHTQGAEGTWTERRAAGLRAFFEWLPIRDPAGGLPSLTAAEPPTAYRSFDFGSLARVIMLDTRVVGRDAQLTTTQFVGAYTGTNLTSSPPDVTAAVQQTLGVVTTQAVAQQAETAVAGSARSLLGTTQEDWVRGQVQDSVAAGQTWQLFGQQILFHYIASPDYTSAESGVTATQQTLINAFLDQQFGDGSGNLFSLLGQTGLPSPDGADSWIGYPSARRRFYDTLLSASNPVILSGDSHNAWAANLRSPVDGSAVGVEIAGPSISSPGLEEYLALPEPNSLDPAVVSHIFTREDLGDLQYENTVNASATLAAVVDDLIYADTSQRGFVLVTVTPEQVTAKYLFVNTVFTRDATLNDAATRTFTVQANAKTLA